MTRPPTQMLFGLAVFVVLFAFCVAGWLVGSKDSYRSVEASLDLGDSELSGLRTSKCFSPDGSVFFDARGSTVQAWVIDDRRGTDDDRAIHVWKDTYGGSDVALAAREVHGAGVRPAIELAVLAKQKKTIRLYRFHHTLTGAGFHDESFSVEYTIDAAELDEAVRIAYRPGSDEFLVFFKNGHAKRFSISSEGEVRPIQWNRTEEARNRGLSPADSLRLHGAEVNDAAFSADGAILATVNRSTDRSVTIVSFRDETVFRTAPVVDDLYYTVAVAPRGERIAAARGKGPIDVFRRTPAGWELSHRLPAAEDEKADYGLAFVDTRELVAAGHDEVRCWDVDAGILRSSFGTEDDDQLQAFRAAREESTTRLVAIDKHGLVRGWTLLGR